MSDERDIYPWSPVEEDNLFNAEDALFDSRAPSTGVLWNDAPPIYSPLADDDDPDDIGPRRLRFLDDAPIVLDVRDPVRPTVRQKGNRLFSSARGGQKDYESKRETASLPYPDEIPARTFSRMEPVTDDRLELGHYLTILKRRWAWVLGPLVLVTLAAATLNLRQPDTYGSGARVLLNANSASQVIDGGVINNNAAIREVENEIAFAKSDVVEELVRQELGDLPSGVSISSTDSADVMIFRATAETPETAALNANTWAEAFVTAKQQQSIDSSEQLIDTFRGNLERLVAEGEALRVDLDIIEDDLAVASEPADIARIQRLRDREERRIGFQLDLIETEVGAITQAITQLQINGQLIATGDVQVLQAAAPATDPSNSPLWQSLFLGLFAGAMLGVGSAFLRNSLDQAIKTSADLTALGLPVLGSIPRPPRNLRDSMDTILARYPESAQAEGFNEVRASIQYLAMSQDLTSILMTSANAGEGKTVTTANLALSMAHVNQVTLAADVDLRRPRLHTAFGHDRTPGIVDHFLNDEPMEDLVHHQSEFSPNLYFIAAGTPTPRPGDLLATRQFLNTLMSLEKQADIVLMDGPPVLPVADPQALARSADAAVLCVRAGKTKKTEVRAAVDKLNKAGANVVGAILTDVTQERGYKAYYQEM